MNEKKCLVLDGLACAACAAKIEDRVRKLDGVKQASLDFSTSRLTIVADPGEMPAIAGQVKSIAEGMEEGITVRELDHRQNKQPESKAVPSWTLARLGSAGLMLAAALVLGLPGWAELALCLAGWVFAGGDVLWKAVRNITKGQVFDENFLMGLATVGAMAIGEYPEAVAVMLFYQVGELFQAMAVRRSRRSIGNLMDIRPDYANLLTDRELRRVSPEEVRPGDIIQIKPGEKVPLDGRVTGGRSALDTSALTGESLPRDVGPGDDVLAGSVNGGGLLTVKVTKAYGESTAAKILDMVQNASSRKAPAENFMTKFARYYTPAVVASAVLLAIVPPLFLGFHTFSGWLNRALIFLVVSCPCALVISIPLSFFGGIGGASRRGVLVKGGNYLDALTRVDTVVFDKTGTLTRGVFRVAAVLPSEGMSEAELLSLAARAEAHSNHPIAASIVRESGIEPGGASAEGYEELAGYGVKALVGGKTVLAGSKRLMEREGIAAAETGAGGAAVHVAVGGKYAGHIIVADEAKPDAARAVAELRKLGIRRLAMLTGDNAAVADRVGRELGLDEVLAGLLPDGKVEALERLEKEARGKVLYAGDGINDAPVLARAGVGVAMGGLGSDAAIEAADVVLMTDEPSRLADAIRIARRTRAIVLQNIIFALGVKGLFLLLGALGVATMWEAVFADVGVALIAVLNAMRVMRNR